MSKSVISVKFKTLASWLYTSWLENRTMAKSTRREKVKLVSTAGTGFYYTLNKLKGQDKLLLKKYDPKVRKHVEFKEARLTK